MTTIDKLHKHVEILNKQLEEIKNQKPKQTIIVKEVEVEEEQLPEQE